MPTVVVRDFRPKKSGFSKATDAGRALNHKVNDLSRFRCIPRGWDIVEVLEEEARGVREGREERVTKFLHICDVLIVVVKIELLKG